MLSSAGEMVVVFIPAYSLGNMFFLRRQCCLISTVLYRYGNKTTNIPQRSQYRYYIDGKLTTKPDLSKDIILFKYDNQRYFRIANFLGFIQYCVWLALGMETYNLAGKVSRESPPKPSDPWYKKIDFSEYARHIGVFYIFLGTAVLTGIVVYNLKSVRYLILNKGGKKVSFVSYTPLEKNMIRTIPLNCVSCNNARKAEGSFVTIRAKGDWFNYLLDRQGEFKHPQLFDITAGVARNLKN